jgi:Trk K+ transport system NAD-binding subunit
MKMWRPFRRGSTRDGRRVARRERVIGYLVGLVVVMVLYAVLYQFTMATFEDQRVSFPKALLAVVETFTTTGYGEDAQFWESVQMQVLMIAMQLTGVSAVFLALPVFVAPWVESRLSETAPTAVEDMTDHVVVAGYTSRVDALIDELSALDRPYVVVEPDRELANELYAETELNVIHGDPELEDTLSAAEVGRARALVCDVDDETNASIVLAAHGMGVDGVDITTFVEDPAIAAYHRYAGADEVFSPRQLIGESLAKKVTAGVTPELDGAIEIAEDFDIVELPVQAGSEIVGKTVAEAGVRERTGTNIVGAWFRGEFASPPPPDARIDEQTILVVAGRERQLERLKELTLSERRRQNGGPVVVAGFDEVGTTVVEQIGGRVETVVVDRLDKPGVDVVGDVTDEATLREAGVDEASTVIIAVSDDTTTVFATLVLREFNPDVEIIARADATESVRKLYQAGADYVLALATVSGRMLASTILDEEVISFDQQVEIVRVGCGSLVGRTLAEADVRARTGVTVLAVERDEDVLTDLGPDFRIQRGDDLVVAGTDADMNRFAAFVGE